MKQFVWSMGGEPVRDLFRYVLMESGNMCVDMWYFKISTGQLLLKQVPRKINIQKVAKIMPKHFF